MRHSSDALKHRFHGLRLLSILSVTGYQFSLGLLSIGTSTAELVQLYMVYLLDIQQHEVYPAIQGIIFSWIGSCSVVLDPQFGYI